MIPGVFIAIGYLSFWIGLLAWLTLLNPPGPSDPEAFIDEKP